MYGQLLYWIHAFGYQAAAPFEWARLLPLGVSPKMTVVTPRLHIRTASNLAHSTSHLK